LIILTSLKRSGVFVKGKIKPGKIKKSDPDRDWQKND
jgi:hypothetical protein